MSGLNCSVGCVDCIKCIVFSDVKLAEHARRAPLLVSEDNWGKLFDDNQEVAEKVKVVPNREYFESSVGAGWNIYDNEHRNRY